MGEVYELADNAAGNQQAAPDGAPENAFTGPDVNDTIREQMALLKRLYNMHEWVDSLRDDSSQPAVAYPVSKTSDTVFTITSTTDLSSEFLNGQRVLMNAAVPATAFVVSANFTGTQTDVTIEYGVVPADISSVFHAWSKNLRRPAYLNNGQGDNEVVTGADLGDEGSKHPRLGTAAYRTVGVSDPAHLVPRDDILIPSPFSSPIGFGTASVANTGIGGTDVPTNDDLGSMANENKPQLKYVYKTANQALSGFNESGIGPELTGVDVPGADGSKRYRLRGEIFVLPQEDFTGYMRIQCYLGVNGSTTDGPTAVFFAGTYPSIYRETVDLGSGINLTVAGRATATLVDIEIQTQGGAAPAVGDKVGLSIQMFATTSKPGNESTYTVYGAPIGSTRSYIVIEEIIAEGF